VGLSLRPLLHPRRQFCVCIHPPPYHCSIHSPCYAPLHPPPLQIKPKPHPTPHPTQTRKLVANILRTVADSAPPGAVARQPPVLRCYLDWVRDAAAFMRGVPAFGEEFWESSQVRGPGGGLLGGTGRGGDEQRARAVVGALL